MRLEEEVTYSRLPVRGGRTQTPTSSSQPICGSSPSAGSIPPRPLCLGGLAFSKTGGVENRGLVEASTQRFESQLLCISLLLKGGPSE